LREEIIHVQFSLSVGAYCLVARRRPLDRFDDCAMAARSPPWWLFGSGYRHGGGTSFIFYFFFKRKIFHFVKIFLNFWFFKNTSQIFTKLIFHLWTPNATHFSNVPHKINSQYPFSKFKGKITI